MGVPDPEWDFGERVRALLPDLLRFATRLCGSAELAEEVVGEALLRAAASRDRLRDTARLRGWLWKIALHCFHDELAQRTRRREENLAAEPPAAQGDQPAEAVATNDLAEHLAQLVSRLPPRQREVLVLIVYEQLSVAEVARLLDTTTGNVHVNLHHARSALKSQLGPRLLEP